MRLFALVVLFLCQITIAQTNYPKDYFISPLDIPLHLSGSFGELRNNHFHSGLDFKTNQREGLNILAAAQGYVSRIKVSTWGYGKVMYVTHPNGFTSVYAHLLKFSPEIEAYVKKRQYQDQSFEVEYFLKPGEINVAQGQLIALSGNTGGSGGPHLHFEIRDTKTECIINPMFFGYDKLVTDTKKPTINSVYVYPIGQGAHANLSEQPTMVSLTQQKDGSYLAQPLQANGQIGFGINTYDTFDFNYNKNGVFKIQTFVNGTSDFNITFNEFAFHESRYLNAYIDYERLKKQNTWIQRLFIDTPYPLSLVRSSKKYGIVEVKENETYNYKIEVSDYHGNISTVIIPITYTNQVAKIKKPESKYQTILKHKIENLFQKEKISVYVAPNTFYRDMPIAFEVSDSLLTFGDYTIPVHKNYTISFENFDIPEDQISKTYIANAEGKSRKYNKTEFKNGTFKTYVRSMGKFTLAQDTVPPVVRPLFKEGAWLSKESHLKLTITDAHSGIGTYNAYINGQWVLMEYDYKRNLLFYDFQDGKTVNGKNDLKVVVTDNVGNSVNFETHFYRSN